MNNFWTNLLAGLNIFGKHTESTPQATIQPTPQIPTTVPAQIPIRSIIYSQTSTEYINLFNTAVVADPDGADVVVDKIVKYKSIYEEVGIAPWYFVGCLHHMECDQDFTAHLYNGDPLTARTVDEPVGRPIAPPDTPNGYSWLFSAKSALIEDHWDTWSDWSIPGGLYKMEAYNGWGYRLYHSIFSPYLWCGTQYYKAGKYGSDGHFDPSLVSDQIGVACIIKRMQDRKLI